MSEALSPEEKRRKIKEEKRELAEWYESQRLYLRSIKLYMEADAKKEAERVRVKMIKEYRAKAREFEEKNQLDQAANLYYIIGDNVKVRELKEKDPSIVIYYEYLSGDRRINDIVGELPEGELKDLDSYFFEPNKERTEEVEAAPTKSEEPQTKEEVSMGINFCPFCGKDLRRFGADLKFCPYCGKRLSAQ